MKPLIVGEMPSRSSDRYWAFPLSGAVAQTLCQMAGIIPVADKGSRYDRWTNALYGNFDCVNALNRYRPWNTIKASIELREKIESEREVVVCFGARSQMAYCSLTQPASTKIASLRYFQWGVDSLSPTARREVVVIPEIRSRLYQDPAVGRRTGKVLNEAIGKAKQLHETRL